MERKKEKKGKKVVWRKVKEEERVRRDIYRNVGSGTIEVSPCS